MKVNFADSKWNWVKWILVLPVSFIAYFVSYTLVNLLNSFYLWMFDWNTQEGFVPQYVAPIMSSLIGGFACIYYGVKIAPGYKKRVAVILMAVWVLFAGATFMLFLGGREYFTALSIIATVIGLVAAPIIMEEDKLF